jgi:hypothetical protein
MHQISKIYWSRNTTCFGHLLCLSSGVIYHLYTLQLVRFMQVMWPRPHNLHETNQLPSVQLIDNSWWWAQKMPETCRVSWQTNFGYLMHLVGYFIRSFKFVILSPSLNKCRHIVSYCAHTTAFYLPSLSFYCSCLKLLPILLNILTMQ